VIISGGFGQAVNPPDLRLCRDPQRDQRVVLTGPRYQVSTGVIVWATRPVIPAALMMISVTGRAFFC